MDEMTFASKKCRAQLLGRRRSHSDNLNNHFGFISTFFEVSTL